ncbi:hypothetical protein H4R20_007297, partial [Coemansia guatemalensis]
METANEDDLNRRRGWLCREFRGHIIDLDFDDLMAKLHVSADLEKFSNQFRGVFIAMSLRAPAYVNKKLTKTNIVIEGECRILAANNSISDSQLKCLNSFKGVKSLGRCNEEALVAYFMELMSLVRLAQSSFLLEEHQSWPTSAYSLSENQNTPVSGGRHK